MLKNLLVQYKGGGYDGCFWEYNHFFWDENGDFQNLVSTGYAGVKNESEALALIKEYNSYFTAKEIDPVWGRYAKPIDLTFVNILNRHSVIDYVDNYNASMVGKVADLGGWELLERFRGHCYECGDLLPIGSMYVGYNGKDFFCEDCINWEEE